MQTVTAPGATARTFLIHMFRRGLDDNRYVVERYKSTFDGEIIRWPCKGKSKTGKHECARLTGASAAGESPAGRRRQATTSTPSHGPSFARMEVKR